MIIGIGIDIVEIERFRKILNRRNHSFLNRVFTKGEINHSIVKKNLPQYYAGRFSAKEAILKALGTGLSKGITWQDVIIIKNKNGGIKPILKGNALKIAKTKKITHWHLSITHTESLACAFAIAER